MAAFIYRYKTSLKCDIGLISLVSCNAAVTKDRCCIIAIIIIIKTKNRLSNKQTSGPNGPVGNNLLFPQYYLIFFHLIISLLPSCNIKCNYIKITKALAFLWPPPPKKNHFEIKRFEILNFSSVHMNKKLEMTWNSFNHNPNPHR